GKFCSTSGRAKLGWKVLTSSTRATSSRIGGSFLKLISGKRGGGGALEQAARPRASGRARASRRKIMGISPLEHRRRAGNGARRRTRPARDRRVYNVPARLSSPDNTRKLSQYGGL